MSLPVAPDPESTFTIEQIALRWQCSTDTVRREISRGNLRAIRVGRLIRVRHGDLVRAERPVTPLVNA